LNRIFAARKERKIDVVNGLSAEPSLRYRPKTRLAWTLALP